MSDHVATGKAFGVLARPHLGLVAPLAALAGVGGLAFVDGGYFPSSWGWATLGFLAVAGVRFASGRAAVAGVLEVAFVAGFFGLAALMLLSALWSESAWRAPLEAQRALLYAAGVTALLAVATSRSVRLLPWAVLGGVAAASAYGLATRLFPADFGVFDPLAGYRLAEPVGYWNGMGVLAAVGLILALGLAAVGGRVERAAAGALVPLLAATLYFTFSRGAWIVAGIGLVAALALSRRPLRLATSTLLLLPIAGAVVFVAARSEALTTIDAELSAAVAEGRRVATAVLVASVVAAAAASAIGFAGERLDVGRAVRRAYGALLVAGAAGLAVAAVLHLGGPTAVVERAYDAFHSPPPRVERDLNDRLRSFSGNGRPELWQVAADSYASHALLGTGAGTYERVWLRDPAASFKVRDAHSLYLEVLTELGPAGLALLVLALGAPLVAFSKARAQPLAGTLAGGYLAFLVHAAVDWDWELPAATFAALALGATLLVAARRREPRCLARPSRTTATLAVAALCGVAVVGLLGNRQVARAQAALGERDYAAAAEAARAAAAYAPWSPQPLVALAEVQLAAGYPEAARETLRDAIAMDGGEWRAWYVLGLASEGAAREAAFQRVRVLNRIVRLPEDQVGP